MSQKLRSMVENENAIQAVLIADNFNENFEPVSTDIPLALLPIVNVPIIDYTLEFLSLGGVTETFIFCCSHVDLIRKHIEKSIEQSIGWSITMKTRIIVSETCRSFGDAMRDLDAKGLIRGDFVLLGADTVANIKLLPILKRHGAICKKDKGAAMTLILQKSGSEQGVRSPEKIIIGADTNDRVLYHKILHPKTNVKTIDFPLEIFVDNPQVSLRMDLKDTQIAICSSSVLPLFTDNFDFQTRDDFVRGLLMDEEILASTIYWHEIKGNQYGGAVKDWRHYQTLSHDIIHRWVYPMVPDVGFSLQETLYLHLRNNIYRSSVVKLAKDCQLIEDVVIGHGASVMDKCSVRNTIIGDNCKIGKNVTITDSYIFADTTVEDNCVIASCCISFHCLIGKNSVLTNGCVLGKGVQLKANEKLDNSIVVANKPDDDYASVEKLGNKAFKVNAKVEEKDSDSDEEHICHNLSRFHLDAESDGYESDDSVESLGSENPLSHTNSPPPDDTNLFLSEVIDSLTRGFEDKLQCDNLILEINSSRYAYNVTVREVNYNVVKAILNMPFHLSTGQPYLLSLRSLLTHFLPIMTNYMRNEDAMRDCLQAIEDVAASSSEFIECVSKVLHWLYEKDVIGEDVLLNWHECLDDTGRLRARIQPFIQWLQDADEESESD